MRNFTGFGRSDYLEIIGKRRWWFLVTMALIIVGSSAYAWKMAEAFKSETRIMVGAFLVPEDYVRPSEKTSKEDHINAIREQLASRSFLEEVTRRYRLNGYGSDPHFVMEDAIKLVGRQIKFERESNNVFTLSFVASEPHFAQYVTRKLAAELIGSVEKSHKDTAVATSEFVDQQLRDAAEALARQEEKVKQFKISHIGSLSERSGENLTAIGALQTRLLVTENALQQARDQRRLLEFRALQSQNPAHSPLKPENGLTPLESELVQKKALLEQYMTKYTSSYPDVVELTRGIEELERQLADTKNVAKGKPANFESKPRPAGKYEDAVGEALTPDLQFEAKALNDNIRKWENEKKEILQKISDYQKLLGLQPVVEQELSSLLREEQSMKDEYDNLRKQKFTAQLAETVATDEKSETYRIIDEANLPIRAQFPNRLHVILIGGCSGLLLGIGAAISRELMNPAIDGEKEAQRLLGLPVLVSLPKLPGKRKQRGGEGKAVA